ncbi:MAG: hypothetical protein Q8O62_04920 [Aequorivita sp.]|nr:hypothetical protein [Aequorivita sp.]
MNQKENKISLLRRIKYWFNDLRHNREHNQNAKRLNKRYNSLLYKPKSNSIIKILTEIEKKAGLSAYDIVPFLKKINLMPSKYSYVEQGSEGSVTDRKRNNELFKELEDLGFLRIIENKLFSNHNGTTYPTPTEECVLKVKLLPKGIDYLIEHRKIKGDNFFKILSAILLLITIILSLPQACNSIKDYKKVNYTETKAIPNNCEI